MNTATQEDLRSPEEIQNEEIKKEFVAFLHNDARDAKVPATCDKAWLANEWKNGEKHFAFMFVIRTEKTPCIPDPHEFYKQAAETYKG